MTPAEIKRLRNDLGMTQQEFGELLGYAPSGARAAVSRLESGTRPIDCILARLCAYIRRYDADARSSK